MIKTKPKRPSADATRNKILAAASQLFIEHGFAGTSMGKLAELADINQSLIFHHFGDKEELWRQVKAAIVAKSQAKPLDPKPANLRDFLTEAIQQRLQVYSQQPELIRLIGWQRLESSKEKLSGIPGNELTYEQWLEPIRYLQEKGKIRSTLEPKLIMVWLVASVNAMIVDDINLFKNNPKNKKSYIDMLVDGLGKALF